MTNPFSKEESIQPSDERNGCFLDGAGCCKVCDGEIPYGHTENCDIWKLEDEIRKLKSAKLPVETSQKPARDAEHCDFPDCEQHNTLVVARLRTALKKALRFIPGEPGGGSGSDFYRECVALTATDGITPVEPTARQRCGWFGEGRGQCLLWEGHKETDHTCEQDGRQLRVALTGLAAVREMERMRAVEPTPPHPGPSIEKAFARSPRRIDPPGSYRDATGELVLPSEKASASPVSRECTCPPYNNKCVCGASLNGTDRT